jgi:hypothetical protein
MEIRIKTEPETGHIIVEGVAGVLAEAMEHWQLMQPKQEIASPRVTQDETDAWEKADAAMKWVRGERVAVMREKRNPGYEEECQEHEVPGRLCSFVHTARLPASVLQEALALKEDGNYPLACQLLRRRVPGLGLGDAKTYVDFHLSWDAREAVEELDSNKVQTRVQGTPVGDVLTPKQREVLAEEMRFYGRTLIDRWIKNGTLSADKEDAQRIIDALVAWVTGERL